MTALKSAAESEEARGRRASFTSKFKRTATSGEALFAKLASKNADQRVNKLVSTLSRASKGSEYATGLQQMGYHLPDHRGSSALERLGRNLSNVKRWQLRAGSSASNSGQHPATPAASLDA